MSDRDDYPMSTRLDVKARAATQRQMRGRMEDVTGIVRRIAASGKALALWAGETEDVQDPRSGEIRAREVWVWLPIKSIDWPGVADIKAITGKTETLRVQEWLAKDKGLI
jgi:hypothetical protein